MTNILCVFKSFTWPRKCCTKRRYREKNLFPVRRPICWHVFLNLCLVLPSMLQTYSAHAKQYMFVGKHWDTPWAFSRFSGRDFQACSPPSIWIRGRHWKRRDVTKEAQQWTREFVSSYFFFLCFRRVTTDWKWHYRYLLHWGVEDSYCFPFISKIGIYLSKRWKKHKLSSNPELVEEFTRHEKALLLKVKR